MTALVRAPAAAESAGQASEPTLGPSPTGQRPPAEFGGEPAWLWKGTVPSLNGLRAVSILIVLFSHVGLKEGTAVSWIPNAGELGVNVFFVISGFLITLLLLREEKRTRTISLKGFYVRRAFRILPAYGSYLLALFLLQCLSWTEISAHGWTTSLTYTSSISHPDDDWDVGHTWSLSVEEHFYLLWPLLFLVLRGRGALYAALGYVLLTPLLRLVLLACGTSIYLGFFTLTRMDSIAVGCCLAFLATSPAFRRWATPDSPGWFYLWFSTGVVLLAAGKWLVLSSAPHSRLARAYASVLSDSFSSLVIGGLIWLAVTHGRNRVGRLLNCRVLNGIGVLSYSLYLWQQPFLNPHKGTWACQWPVNFGLLFGAALVSYVAVESPFLRLKERLSARHG